MKTKTFAMLLVASALSTPLYAQDTPAPADEDSASNASDEMIIVTGSRIKRDPKNSPVPLDIITPDDLTRESITSPEQLISLLSTNGNGADNLAANSDVVTGAQRGTNGLSAANLRGQGSASTLVLLNGRRVAAHGLQGSAVDVNQIPLAAIERVEVLKDGASAIYGTDAVGGVINFITKTNFQGLALNGFADVAEPGDSTIYRISATGGYGDIDSQGFNIMGAVSKSWNSVLYGNQRAFVNGNQPQRGLSVDTRGTPIATVFNIGTNAIQTPNGTLLSGLTITAPNGANAAAGGINFLDLPDQAGCGTMDGGMPYDEVLWSNPSAIYSCAWDTGRAAVLQQPLETLTYYGRGVVRLGDDHQLSLEVTGSSADSAKRFSHAQLTANTTNLPWAMPRTAATATTYDTIVNAIRSIITNPAELAAFNVRAAAQRPISGRWRCIACGPREYVTETDTFRVALGLEGTLFAGWDYRAGASYAKSESSSTLGSGYYYRGTLANGAYDTTAPQVAGAPGTYGLLGAINSGLVNPFVIQQSAEGEAALRSVSAEGAVLYGGQYEVKQFDASVSGPLFSLWGNDVQAAFGVDYRRETYSFNGSAAAAATAPVIFLAAFDNVNALTPKSRDVKAAYAEILVPLGDMIEITGAARVDDYTGFGSTVNPKVSAKFRPVDWLMFRGSFNTGFRVPTFNQIYNGVTDSPNPGATLTDPTTCPVGGTVNVTPGCTQINPNSLTGGNLNLGPETSEQYSVGVVFEPVPQFSASVDFWSIAVDNTIGALTISQLLNNQALFPDRVIRTGGVITTLDLRADNIGSRRTQGIEVSLRGGFDALGGSFSAGLDGTYLVKKKERFLASAPYGPSLIGVFSLTGDLGLRWKHNAWLTYRKDGFSFSFSQIFRDGYANQALPGSAARPGWNPRVDDYIIYNLSTSVTVDERFKLTAGVKNIFNTDPPFAVTYDSNTGSGSSWEPRVADPRGRSFTIAVEAKF